MCYYNYEYDAENRLIKARTGINSTSSDGWEIENAKTDAAYRYYLHGPLSRMKLGNTALVQGLDYAYTLQGWLKGVNGHYLSAANDMGKDGVVDFPHAVVARDAYAYTLDYFNGDYKPVGTSQTAVTLSWIPLQGDVMGRNLYNGNISRSTLALSNINGEASVGYTYRYDQLNRLTAMRQHSLANNAITWNTVSTGLPYKEDVSYDGNGNILSYVRYGSGANSKGLPMDSMKYIYPRDASGYLSSNRLTQVQDSVINDAYTEDISNQSANNYLYDNIGNLIKDTEGGITNIQWTVYGKIKTITKADGSSLEYRYDALGNRIYKSYTHAGVTDKTWYVRDAQGNALAIYGNKDGGTTLYWKEQQLYGSSRLGIWEPNLAVGTDASTIWDNLGLKRYELSNHLGNVLATISDKPILEGDHYKAELLSAQDYYPFGMLQPDRRYSLGSYRYGFNGQEKSDEIAGEGNHNTALFWEYDTRIGRRWNLDPEPAMGISEYAVLNNSPLLYSDLLGNSPRGSGDNEDPTLLRKLWNGIVYQANFSTISFKGWHAGWEDSKGVAFTSGLGLMNGVTVALSVGTINRSPQSIGLIPKYHRGFHYATLVGAAIPIPGEGGGASSGQAFAYSAGGSESIAKVANVFTKAVQTNNRVLSNSGNEELGASYHVPDEHSKSGKGFLGGFATLKDGYFELALETKDLKTGEYKTIEGTPGGREIFGILYNKIVDAGGKVTGIIGNWNVGTNLDKFNQLLLDDKTLQEAAIGTFTGGQAKDRGFTQAELIGGVKNADGKTYKSANIKFTKPH